MSPIITWREGVSHSDTKYHMGGGGLAKMSRDNFLLVILLVQVDVREVGGGGV